MTIRKLSPYVVALTGGIASGKTAVSDRFAVLSVPIIDTDVIAHQVVDTDEETQIRRVMQRDGVSRQQAEVTLASQTSRPSLLLLADDVIENKGS